MCEVSNSNLAARGPLTVRVAFRYIALCPASLRFVRPHGRLFLGGRRDVWKQRRMCWQPYRRNWRLWNAAATVRRSKHPGARSLFLRIPRRVWPTIAQLKHELAPAMFP